MRFSAVAALCAAPLALASSLQADLVARGAVAAEKGGAKANTNSGNTIVVQESGAVSSTEVIIIWVNNGGGAATQTVATTQSVIASSTISAATHQVTVGGSAGLVYTPDQVAANVGDMVVFTFLSQNHTATQSAFTTPCEKLTGGMDSGFMPNINGSVNPPPQMAMQVTVATPIWFYCRQTGHCGKGMTFSINPQNGTNGFNKTQAAFQQLAIAQNGTGATAVIAGGTGASSSAAPISLASATASAAAVQSASSSSGSLTSGTGTINSNGACDCSCLCGTAAFPNAAIQGIGGFGGMSGAMPMSALEVSVTTSTS